RKPSSTSTSSGAAPPTSKPSSTRSPSSSPSTARSNPARLSEQTGPANTPGGGPPQADRPLVCSPAPSVTVCSMQWQDLVLAVSQLSFTAALLPTLLSKDKPALTTSLMNGTILLVVAFTLSTLALWFAA